MPARPAARPSTRLRPAAADAVDRRGLAYEQLRALIIRGRLAPGVRVVENDVATRLGVSRTPAREAMRRLHQEGFLVATTAARRTELVVAPLTDDDMWDLYEIMAALEGAAARGAAQLGADARVDLARALADLEAAFEAAGRVGRVDYDRLFELHNAFHLRLVDAGARPRLRALIETVRPQVERYEWVYAPLVGPDHEATFSEHASIIAAMRDGTAADAHDAVVANWRRSASRLAAVIGQVGTRGDW